MKYSFISRGALPPLRSARCLLKGARVEGAATGRSHLDEGHAAGGLPLYFHTPFLARTRQLPTNLRATGTLMSTAVSGRAAFRLTRKLLRAHVPHGGGAVRAHRELQ